MITYRQSIRLKVRLGYYAIVAVIIGLSAFTLIELNILEKKIMFGEAISEFFDTTLEIRRFEKNYFLYEKKYDFDENSRYVTKAQDLLQNNPKAFAAIASPEQIERLQTGLTAYKSLMERYEYMNRLSASADTVPDSAPKIALSLSIRKAGNTIITVAEEIAKTERKSIQALLGSSRDILILSIASLVVLVIIIGQVLGRVVVKPLKLMENSMQLIADGKFEQVRIDSRDREVLSLTNAFNKMLRELELKQRHLVQSEKLASLGTLLSGVAHELNNPLSNISSSSQILAEEIKEGLGSGVTGQGKIRPMDDENSKNRLAPCPLPLDPAFIMELIHQINEQTDRARDIVRSLLDFSRTRDFKKQAVPLKPLMEETIRFVRGQIPTDAAVTVSLPDDAEIFADKQRLQQAFLNLIKNAIEAMPERGGMLSIKAEKRRAIDDVEDEKISIYNYMKYRGKCTLENDTVDIEIHDNGAGIPLDVLPKIFDPFFTTKEVGKGSGLGLFIVHEIIEEHDGCIAVDSVPERGTTFLIRLPVK